jgi:hypothetical protein
VATQSADLTLRREVQDPDRRRANDLRAADRLTGGPRGSAVGIGPSNYELEVRLEAQLRELKSQLKTQMEICRSPNVSGSSRAGQHPVIEHDFEQPAAEARTDLEV